MKSVRNMNLKEIRWIGPSNVERKIRQRLQRIKMRGDIILEKNSNDDIPPSAFSYPNPLFHSPEFSMPFTWASNIFSSFFLQQVFPQFWNIFLLVFLPSFLSESHFNNSTSLSFASFTVPFFFFLGFYQFFSLQHFSTSISPFYFLCF